MKRIFAYTLGIPLALSLTAVWGGCTRYGEDTIPATTQTRFSVAMASRAADLTTDQSEEVYGGMRFLAYEHSSGIFSHEVILTRESGAARYTGMMRTGADWGLTAVAPDASRSLTLPVGGASMASTPMYTMSEDAATCPEYFFDSQKLDEVVEDQDMTVTMPLARNMSQVYVRILDKHGVVQENSAATITLHEVPTTISWAGTILPNTTTPTTRTNPITFTIAESEVWRDTTIVDGTTSKSVKMSSDSHYTVIPAHRGTDFWDANTGAMNQNPTDILKHKMKIGLIYIDKYGNSVERPQIEVPQVPLCNGRIIYNLIPLPQNADVDIEVERLPWNVAPEQDEVEYITPTANSNCIVVAPGATTDIPLKMVYQMWNWLSAGKTQGEDYYLDNDIDQTTDKPRLAISQTYAEAPLEAVVLSGGQLISAEIANPCNSSLGTHRVLRVSADASVTGEATVALRVSTDAQDVYRWAWHVHVTDAPAAVEQGHCDWALTEDNTQLWATGQFDVTTCAVVNSGSAASPLFALTKVATLTTGPGVLPVKLTLRNYDNDNPLLGDNYIYLWNNGTLFDSQHTDGAIYAAPGHAVDIYLQAAADFTGGKLVAEFFIPGTSELGLDDKKEVMIGVGTLSAGGTATAPHAGANGLAMQVPQIAVSYPDGTTGTVSGTWTAVTCDENGHPAASGFVTLVSASASGTGSITMNVAAQTPVPIEAQWQPAQGSAASPFDLSTAGGTMAMNTANCYVINAPGTYSLPLVYGNAIKDGSTNASAYTSQASGTYVLTRFINHLGVSITDPYIYNNSNCTPASVRLIWQDVRDLVSDIRLSDDSHSLVFTVGQATIAWGNAVIAVCDASDRIMWSWHIWITDYKLGEDLKSVTYSGTHTMLPYNLGWCPGPIYETRSQYLLLTEAASGTAVIATVDQPAGQYGNSPYYQWGRKDPMLPSTGTDNTNKTWYDASGASSTTLATASWGTNSETPEQTVIANGHSNPGTFCLDNAMGAYYNLWAADNASTVWGLTTSVKTVYDPCPAGYKVPLNNAFRAFVTTDNVTPTASQINGTWNAAENGWDFTCAEGSVFFPASGYRLFSSGGGINVNSSGNYWTAVPAAWNTGRYLSSNRTTAAPLGSNVRSYGFLIRPVTE